MAKNFLSQNFGKHDGPRNFQILCSTMKQKVLVQLLQLMLSILCYDSTSVTIYGQLIFLPKISSYIL